MTNCTCGDKPKRKTTPPTAKKPILTIEERHGAVVYRG